MKNNNINNHNDYFVGRNDELKHLKQLYKRSKNELIVYTLTGHRRVGKTTLINHFSIKRAVKN